MNIVMDFNVVDTAVFIVANLINVGMIVIFLVRVQGNRRVERAVGLVQIALIVPLAWAAAVNAAAGRSAWLVLLPVLMIAFLLVELLLDYILQANFRQSRLLGPYLLLYYVALMGMVGYTFLTRELFGFITLATYFAQLAATAYSYRRVGHGTDSPTGKTAA